MKEFLNNPSFRSKLLIFVAALGYFVDVYDLIIFSVIRSQSLTSLGFSGDELIAVGIRLMNYQMVGLLIGGILWGILGDKKGRVSVLFGSILVYSAANFINGFIENIHVYAALRLIAGIGLAGELGAGITLVNENLSPQKRGYGTLMIAGVGAMGAMFAQLVANYSADPEWWRMTFKIGGVFGILLLMVRIGAFESSLYKNMDHKIEKGNFLNLFKNKDKFLRYVYCILIGTPIWYLVGIIVFLAPEFSVIKGIEQISGGEAIFYCYLGLSLGDFCSGLLSQFLKSRRKALFIFVASLFIFVVIFLYLSNDTSKGFNLFLISAMGFFAGLWAVFITFTSEQFGTNYRSTVTTSVPNFVRAAFIPISLLFEFVRPTWGIIHAALFVGIISLGLSFWATAQLKETFGRSLEFTE